MGSQLSSSQQSPGLSSLGSNGQQSRHGRSPPPNSASQNSLALCSSSASSSAGGRHSAALIRGRSLLHSSPPSSCASSSAGALFQSRFLVSPPMFRRRHEHQQNARKSAASGAGSGLSRWGSFTRALPSLVRGNSGGGAKHNGHGHLLAKEQQKRRQMMTTGNGRVPKYEADPNNNDPYSHHQNLAFYEQGRPKTLWSDEEEEAEDDEVEESPGRPHRDFSLKASLKKSGSRLFNGILRGGYFRAFLSDEADDGEADEEEEAEDDENNEEEGEEKVRENERKEAEENQRLEKEEKEGRREEENRRKLGRRETASIASDLLNNNGPACLRQGTAGHFSSSSSSAAAAAACRLRPTNSFFQHQSHKGPTSAINTSTLRSSLRQAKRHLLMPGGGHPPNGGLGGNGLVSSMLLAMAAGQPPPVARPFSCPEPPQTLLTPLDWNGNCERNSALPQLQRKKVIQASSSELIRALGHFIYQHCRPDLLSQFEPAQLSSWLRGVDRALILQGWQDIAFINPANLVFLFMLIRDAFARGENQRLGSLRELHSFVLLCLYISYSYMGNEISYPLKPFITENTNRALFWSQCVRLIKAHSGQMLRLNSSSTFFLETFTEMKDYFP